MAEEDVGENVLEDGDEEEGSGAKQRIITITTEESLDEVITNKDNLDKKVIVVAWLMPGDKRCDEMIMPYLKKMKEDHIIILVVNPDTLATRAQQIGLYAVPTFQLYRKELAQTLVGNNVDKLQAYFRRLYRDLQEQLRLEKFIERSAPTDSTLASGEKAEPEVPVFSIGVGWSSSLAEADPPVEMEVMAFLLTDSGKVPTEKHVVHSNHSLIEGVDAIKFTRNAADRKNMEEDDCVIDIALDTMEPNIMSVVFVAAILKAEEKEQNLEQAAELYIRSFDREQKKAMFIYNVAATGMVESAAVIGKFERAEEGSQTWEFVAALEPVEGGYQGALGKFTETKIKKKKKIVKEPTEEE